MNLIKPSFSTGYAKNASESANPNLWKGLVGAWMPSFGVTGGTLKDVSGNGNDGTLTFMQPNGWEWTKNGSSLKFDGGNDYVDINPDHANSAIGSQVSIEALVFPRQINHYRVIGGGQDTTFIRYSCSFNVGALSNQFGFDLEATSGQVRLFTSASSYLNKWSHLVGTYDGNTARLYLNGRYKAGSSATSGNVVDFDGIVLGRDINLSAGRVFYGFMSLFRIYNRALSPSEIKQLYLNPAAPFQKKTTTVVSVPVAPPTTTAKAVVLKKPKPSYATGYAKNASESASPNLWKGLVGAWMPSFGVTGETLKDVSGNGNDGTLTNMNPASDWVGTSKGQGLEFGYLTNESIQVDSSSLSSSEGSFFCWYKRTSAMANQRDAMLFTGFTSSSIRNFLSVTSWFTANGQPVVLPSFNVSGPTRWVVGPPVYLNEWMHFGYDWSDGKPMRLWVNGRFYGQTSGLFVDYGNYSSVKIGNYSSLSLSASGVIADAFSYNRALSPTEIKQLYLNPAAPFDRKQQTVGLSTAAVVPSANFNPFSVLTHPLEQ